MRLELQLSSTTSPQHLCISADLNSHSFAYLASGLTTKSSSHPPVTFVVVPKDWYIRCKAYKDKHYFDTKIDFICVRDMENDIIQ